MRLARGLLAAALGCAALAAACAPAAGASATSPADGMALVFVPAGPFRMGSAADDPEADPDEQPAHEVYLAAYWIDRTEVTNAMFGRCVEAGGCAAPMHSRRYLEAGYAAHPVVGVAWPQAEAYCRWAGRRLPTEAEWEKAARGPDGRAYPWGNAPPDPALLNFGGLVNDTTPAGAYPQGASPYGALDMAGNAWEWAADGYDAAYYSRSTYADPPGGFSAGQRVIRGGSWSAEGRAARAANRFWAFPGRNDTDGFRCAVGARPGETGR